MACIEARGLRKAFGATVLDGIGLRVKEGRILGLMGPNGAGKSPLLNAIPALIPCGGELAVPGLGPWTRRDRLMRDVPFIAEVP